MNVMVLTGTWFCMGSKAGFRGLGFAGECLRRLRNKILWLGASECFLSTFDYLQTERPIGVRRPRHGEQVDSAQTEAGGQATRKEADLGVP